MLDRPPFGELSAIHCHSSSAAMADLPRWVPRSDVDSRAMLAAFIKYHREASENLRRKHQVSYQPIWEGHLWSFKHRCPDGVNLWKAPMPLRIPQLPCQERACSRCGTRGGYVFRWYSPYWARYYNERARPGAWRAPEPHYADPQVSQAFWLQHERFWRPSSELS